MHGPEAIRSWIREFLKQWADVRQELEELTDCGESAFAVSRQSAVGRASGARLEMPIYNVWRFRDGKVVEFLTTRHEGTARRAAGLDVR